jgi:hypothetical protein
MEKQLYDYIDEMVLKYKLNERERNELLKLISIDNLKNLIAQKVIMMD